MTSGLEINDLRHMLLELLGSTRRILVDLAEVSHVDSVGIGVLVEAQALAINIRGQMRLCHPAPGMALQISRLGLEHILKIYDTEAAALADWLE